MPGDCRECGACCFSSSDSYVPATADDEVRLGEKSSAVVRDRNGVCFMKMNDGHCAQLEHLEGDWVCRIYKLRPNACRELKRGSPECLAERALKRRTTLITSKRLLRSVR